MILVRIQHHPARFELLPPLLESLAPLNVEVSTHASEPPSPWAGYKQALSDTPTGVTHICVLQDDVRVCRNFPLAVEKIAEANPDVPVCLFLGGQPRRTAKDALRASKAGKRYVQLFFRDFVPVVGVLWPRHKAEEFLEWSRDARLPGQSNPRSDDAVVGRWMLMTRQRVLATVPSLVQHPDEVPSLIGRRAHAGKDKGRVALLYCEGDPMGYDWS